MVSFVNGELGTGVSFNILRGYWTLIMFIKYHLFRKNLEHFKAYRRMQRISDPVLSGAEAWNRNSQSCSLALEMLQTCSSIMPLRLWKLKGCQFMFSVSLITLPPLPFCLSYLSQCFSLLLSLFPSLFYFYNSLVSYFVVNIIISWG